MNSTQKSTPQIMHYAFKTWCIVSTSGRYAKKVLISYEIRTFSLLFKLKSLKKKSMIIDFDPNLTPTHNFE